MVCKNNLSLIISKMRHGAKSSGFTRVKSKKNTASRNSINGLKLWTKILTMVLATLKPKNRACLQLFWATMCLEYRFWKTLQWSFHTQITSPINLRVICSKLSKLSSLCSNWAALTVLPSSKASKKKNSNKYSTVSPFHFLSSNTRLRSLTTSLFLFKTW